MEKRFETFTVLIGSISRSIRKIKTEEMAEFNLKSPHVSCIYYLYKNSTLTAKDLCDVCDEDKAAISRSLDYLEKNNYLTCSSTAKKRYKAYLELTEKGNEVGKIISDKIDNILNIASNTLTEEDRVILYKSLSLINNNLQKFCDSYEEK